MTIGELVEILEELKSLKRKAAEQANNSQFDPSASEMRIREIEQLEINPQEYCK